jgi:hypothetical protein
MRITKYIHSCLLVEKGLDKILFDPGKFSFVEGLVKPAQFHDLSAIVLTHHAALKKILDNNPAYARDFFLRQRYENFQKHFSQHGIEFHWLSKPGDSIEV